MTDMTKQIILAPSKSGLPHPSWMDVPNNEIWRVVSIGAFLNEPDFERYWGSVKEDKFIDRIDARTSARNGDLYFVVGEFTRFVDNAWNLALHPRELTKPITIPPRQNFHMSYTWNQEVPWCLILTVESKNDKIFTKRTV